MRGVADTSTNWRAERIGGQYWHLLHTGASLTGYPESVVDYLRLSVGCVFKTQRRQGVTVITLHAPTAWGEYVVARVADV